MRWRIWGLIVKYQNALFVSLFFFSVALAGFASGAYVVQYRVFPYQLAREAILGVRAIQKGAVNSTYESLERRVSEFTLDEVPTKRIENPGVLTSGLLWPGGDGLFREICPERGCLAVEFSSKGKVVHAYPYRLEELDEWEKLVELPRGSVHPFQTPELFKVPHAVRKYSNGDLLVIFNYANASPGKGGVARINSEGMPVWVREDYSHHWPTILPSAVGEELVLVPGTTIGHVPVNSRMRHSTSDVDLDCHVPSRNEVDHVKVLGDDGSVVREIQIIDRIIESPFSSVLLHTTNPCDILHLNYIDRIRDDVHGIPGVNPGDFVVSLRHISAFGILDRETGALKLMVRGTFTLQHSVQHLKGSEFLLFDNLGAGGDVGPSRVLLVDLNAGDVRERTVFPTADTPDDLRVFSHNRGNVSISRDRERMIIASSNQGIGLEVRLSDGAILNVFRNVHNIAGLGHNLEDAGDRAVYLVLQDLQYVE